MPVRILVVDDEADLEVLILRKFRRQIESNEFQFRFAGNGRKAMEALEGDPEIEIVLSDLNMPEVDGLALLAHLAESPRSLKTIVVSAYGDLQNIRRAMNRGAFDFLTKPIDFTDVESTIQKTVRELQRLRDAARTHRELVAMECELELASRIQEAMVPQISWPAAGVSGLELCAEMVTARMVGGDFYDLFQIDSARIGFLIGDVAGKGVPAGLFMTATRALMRATAGQHALPGECLSRVNKLLCRENVPAMYVTIFYGVLNTLSGELEFSVGGHAMPYRFSSDGARSISGEGGPVLGILEDAVYPSATITLAAGEGLLLYTDGVTEAFDASGNEYSNERLMVLVDQLCALPVRTLVTEIFQSIREFSCNAPQSDDITVLALRYPGPSSSFLPSLDLLTKCPPIQPVTLA